MKMNIAKADYSKHRSHILPLIERAAEKNKHNFAMNVDRALLSGRAFLFVCNDGFFILEPTGDEAIEVVFAFSFGGNNCDRYQPVIEQLARSIGARTLFFYTTLRGFSILCKSLGYKKTEQQGRVTLWTKEVVYGEE